MTPMNPAMLERLRQTQAQGQATVADRRAALAALRGQINLPGKMNAEQRRGLLDRIHGARADVQAAQKERRQAVAQIRADMKAEVSRDAGALAAQNAALKALWAQHKDAAKRKDRVAMAAIRKQIDEARSARQPLAAELKAERGAMREAWAVGRPAGWQPRFAGNIKKPQTVITTSAAADSPMAAGATVNGMGEMEMFGGIGGFEGLGGFKIGKVFRPIRKVGQFVYKKAAKVLPKPIRKAVAVPGKVVSKAVRPLFSGIEGLGEEASDADVEAAMASMNERAADMQTASDEGGESRARQSNAEIDAMMTRISAPLTRPTPGSVPAPQKPTREQIINQQKVAQAAAVAVAKAKKAAGTVATFLGVKAAEAKLADAKQATANAVSRQVAAEDAVARDAAKRDAFRKSLIIGAVVLGGILLLKKA